MVNNLSLNVVAEGIELAAAESILLDCNCDLAQGFYYSKPLTINDYIEWL